MKKPILVLLGLMTIFLAQGQNLKPEMLFPDTLRSQVDSFYVTSPRWEDPWSFPITRDDTLNLGTYGYKGVSFTIWTDIDTIDIPHVNYPFRQYIEIPITSNNDTALCILRFQPAGSDFSNDYMVRAKGKYVVDLPEMYELANIALFLSECAQLTNNIPKTEYAYKVRKHFEPYKNHKLIQVLNSNCSGDALWSVYYGFRENSICFGFDENSHIQYNQPYKSVRWDNSKMSGGQFRNMLYLIQDFVNTSNCRSFFAENKSYYEELVEREYELLPINDMWSWLESKFTQRYDSYKVIFSPLITGSHSTQRFQHGYLKEPSFKECIMFINSSENMDGRDISESLKEGLRSGIVFTEIDHNYVNPISKKYLKEIKELMKDKDFWATTDAQQNYSSEYSIFNEYMTHSLFCLYAIEKYEVEIANKIIESRIKMMNRRGYPQFEKFNEILIALMMDNTGRIDTAYPEIIDAMHKIN